MSHGTLLDYAIHLYVTTHHTHKPHLRSHKQILIAVVILCNPQQLHNIYAMYLSQFVRHGNEILSSIETTSLMNASLSYRQIMTNCDRCIDIVSIKDVLREAALDYTTFRIEEHFIMWVYSEINTSEVVKPFKWRHYEEAAVHDKRKINIRIHVGSLSPHGAWLVGNNGVASKSVLVIAHLAYLETATSQFHLLHPLDRKSVV